MPGIMVDGGQSFVSSFPAFSNDAKKLLVCTGNTVSIFSTATGLQVAELEGHTALVTSVVIVPTTSSASKLLCYCWTSSLDGTLCYWDFLVQELIKKVNLELTIFSMVIPSLSTPGAEIAEKPENYFAFISVKNSTKENNWSKKDSRIIMVDLNKLRLVGGPLAETRKPQNLVISKSGKYFGITDKHKILIWKVPDKRYEQNEVKKLKLHHTKKLTALAFHPSENFVAGGDNTGRILLWRGFGKNRFLNQERPTMQEDRPGVRDDDDADSCSTWHWHASEVKCLSFSSDGSYLYSGAKEGTLVVWQLDTGKKKFLPRLGSPLLYFLESPDPTLSCVSCMDNQIHLLKMPSMNILKSISGIKPPFTKPITEEDYKRVCAFDRRAGLVALPTETYCIQFYSLFDNREASQVQVHERNYQPVDDVMVYVKLVVLSDDASKMGTVEMKLPEEGVGGIIALRFWEIGSHDGEYSLSTVIFEPHSFSGISAIAFHPIKDTAVSSSEGGDFKIWIHDRAGEKSGWRCQSIGSYKRRPMTAAVFSADGSILAVAATDVVTLWDPDTNSLISVVGETLSPIAGLSFSGTSHFLVGLLKGSDPQLCVWNMSKLSVVWSYKLSAEAMAFTRDGSRFAVLVKFPDWAQHNLSSENCLQDTDGAILIFDVENPVPLFIWAVKKIKGGSLGFVQANIHDDTNDIESAPSEMLVYMNRNNEYVVFDPFNLEMNKSHRWRKNNLALAEEAGPFGYTSIYGELSKLNTEKVPVETAYYPTDKPWETIFSGPSHLLPPLSKLCSSFLGSLLPKRPTIIQ